MKQFIVSLENFRLKRRFAYTLHLLSMNSETQDEFIKRVVQMKKKYKADRKLHDFSFTMPGDGYSWGITYMVGNHELLEGNLASYCAFKIKQTGLDCWIGIGDSSHAAYQFIEPVMLP